MPRPKSLNPSHRHHKASNRGFVVIDGEYKYTGTWGTQEAVDTYTRLLAEWIARGRTAIPTGPGTIVAGGGGTKVKVFLAAYWLSCQRKYTRADGTVRVELWNIRDALKLVIRLYGELPAADFTTDHLEVVRNEMVRAGNCRNYINRNVCRIVSAFGWGMRKKFVPVMVHHALCHLPPLAPGDDGVRESEPVPPAPAEQVAAVMDLLPGPIHAMVNIQLINAARPSELRKLRTRYIDRSDPDCWEAVLKDHKMAHKKKARALHFNREAQAFLLPYLKPDQPDAYCFSPIDALAERHRIQRENRKTKVQPSQVRRTMLALRRPRKRPPQDHYTKNSYARAIVRACEIAMGMPDSLRRPMPRPKVETPEAMETWRSTEGMRRRAASLWRAKNTWTPGQLRHNALTTLEDRVGIVKASKVAGHSKPDTTRIYALETFKTAREVMKGTG